MTKVPLWWTITALCGFAGKYNVAAQGTDLGGGVITRTDVEYLADLTLDVRDIEQSLTIGPTASLRIYLEGKNSEKDVGFLYKLSELSSELANSLIVQATPMYLFHLYGLAGRSTDLNALSANGSYADSYVRSAIQNGQRTGALGARVLNIWMYATHVLYKGVELCQKRTDADNPAQFDMNGGGLDEFIALWIGSGQTHGSSEGFSLYALAEQSDQLFTVEDVDDTGFLPPDNGGLAESDVNRELKLLYQEGAGIMALPDACSKTNSESPKKLWAVVSQIVKQMYIPLIRMLIISILDQDIEQADLFANALIPQLAQCRPSSYNRLRQELLEGQIDFGRTEYILIELQEIYSCFGLLCSDIGTVNEEYGGANVPLCVASQDRTPLALYRPTSDVHPIARIDLDILQLRILTSLGSFRFAKLWYLHGRNSPRQRSSDNDPFSFYSISDFARATSRRNAEPYYSAFLSYHNEQNYADILIRDTLDGVGKWDSSKSIEQRSAVITESSAFQVLYLHLIAQINDAVNNCLDVDIDGEYDLTHPWDEVAALLIGSLEGMAEGGSPDIQDGQLIWGLSTRRGFQFQTLNNQGYSQINSELEDLLYAGRGEIDALDCGMLQKTAEKIKNLTLIPLMQSVLRYAIQNEQQSQDSLSADIALGEVFALSIIPIVQIYDPASASVLEQNMIIQSGRTPVGDGPQAVADALGAAANSIGISPRQLGSTPQANPSSKYGGSSSSTHRPWLFSLAALAFASVFLTF